MMHVIATIAYVAGSLMVCIVLTVAIVIFVMTRRGAIL